MAAARRGDRATALRCWRELLQHQPDNAEALNALGNGALAAGQLEESLRLLERAASAAPREPAVLFNLAAAQRACGLLSDALASIEFALQADPYFVQAIHQKARLCEDLGKPAAAAAVYRDLLDTVSPAIANDPRFASLLEHARAAVAADNQRLWERLGRADAAPTHRMKEAAAMLAGQQRHFVAEPTFFTIPQLPALPYFPREATAWLDRLEEDFSSMAEEAGRLLGRPGPESDFEPYVANPPGTPLNQWRDLDHNPAWSALFFIKHGKPDPAGAMRCPRTAEVLAGMPMFDCLGRGPNAFLSLLQPRTRIPPHTGVSNCRLTVHLPLIVPESCGFRVGAETRKWQPGKAWVFDDSIEHEAWNDSDEPRVILIFDIWHPELDAAEREYVRMLLAGYEQHAGRSQAAGF